MEPSGRSAPKILIVDDDWKLAVEVQRMLSEVGHLTVQIVHDRSRALAALQRTQPDLLLLDIALGADDGVALAETIRARSMVPIVFLSAHCDSTTLRRAAHVSPMGFVVKPFSRAQLVTAVELACHACPIDDSAQRTLDQIAALVGRAPASAPVSETRRVAPAHLACLSSREHEILGCLVAHQRVPTIARELGISEHTVRNHLKSMFAKLSVHSQEELIAVATRAAGDVSR